MSHADGIAITATGNKYYFEYNGTVDVCCTRLYKKKEELYENWRKDNCRDCTCKKKKFVRVMLSTAYGHWHFLWESKICKKCMAITGKTQDWEY